MKVQDFKEHQRIKCLKHSNSVTDFFSDAVREAAALPQLTKLLTLSLTLSLSSVSFLRHDSYCMMEVSQNVNLLANQELCFLA